MKPLPLTILFVAVMLASATAFAQDDSSAVIEAATEARIEIKTESLSEARKIARLEKGAEGFGLDDRLRYYNQILPQIETFHLSQQGVDDLFQKAMDLLAQAPFVERKSNDVGNGTEELFRLF